VRLDAIERLWGGLVVVDSPCRDALVELGAAD